MCLGALPGMGAAGYLFAGAGVGGAYGFGMNKKRLEGKC